MKCKTCGVYGHDSQGSVELCLQAVKARMSRWGNLFGQLCAAKDQVRLHHARDCFPMCEVCKKAEEIHQSGKAMAAEDGLL